ncbi:FHA domain-containing protein [Timonella senegalensis]|uniref:FHA domain-containing protein n=1 Tax=Timonella senegalensis TaxID=1465825 RepID=UPI0002F9B95A|nr:FHA domain-containing protein [Timonella senegalensis]
MSLAYLPGTGVVFSSSSLVAFFPDSVEAKKVRGFWEEFHEAVGASGFVGALEVIGRHFTTSFEDLPRFVVAEFGAVEGSSIEVRFALCGDISAHVTVLNDPSDKVLHGGGAAMWREVSIPAATRVSIGTPYSGPGSMLLPLGAGVVLANACVWDHAECEASEIELGLGRGPLVTPFVAPVDVEPALDEDFGRTLAEAPESWPEEDAGFDNHDAYGHEGSHAPSDGTAVYGGYPADVMPTEVISMDLNSVLDREAGQGGRGDAHRRSVVSRTAVLAPPATVSAGIVRFSHGEVVELGLPLVVGRKPTHEGSGAAPSARMVSVPSPLKDISRNHLEVRVEGGHVLAIDLGSVNGSVLRRSGAADEALVAHRPVVLINDDVVDLGDGVTLRFERLR